MVAAQQPQASATSLKRAARWLFQAALTLTVTALPAWATALPPLRQPLPLDFDLQVDRDPPASGRLWLLPNGESCIHTLTPVAQRLWLSAQGMTLYYPKTGDLLRHKAGKDVLPSFVDVIVVSLRHPAESLPRGAKLVSRKSTGDVVTVIWQVSDPSGSLKQVLQTKETAGGVAEMAVRDSKNKLLRNYVFGPRRRVGSVSIPATIVATYNGRSKQARTEHWQLRTADSSLPPPRDEARCLDAGRIVREFKF